MTRAVKVIVHGRVQGVWFRGWTQQTARELGLDGWVQNRRDGSVQAVLSGPDEAVEEMLQLCKDGPEFAFVTSIEHVVHHSPVSPGFSVRRTL